MSDAMNLFQTEPAIPGDPNVIAPAVFSPWAVALGLGVLLLFAILLFSIAWGRSWTWNGDGGRDGLRGLALPRGSVRSVLALLIVGGFILFAFIGKGIVGDNEAFTAVLGAWITLTGTVTGFYFGSRTGQTLQTNGGDSEEDKKKAEAVRAAAEEAARVEAEEAARAAAEEAARVEAEEAGEE